MDFIYREWFAIPAIGVCAFIISYLWSDKIIAVLYKRSLGQREEIINLLRTMYIEVDQKRITLILLLISFGLGFVFFLLLWPSIFAGLLVGSIMTIAGWSLPLLFIRSIYKSRQTKFVDQMVDGLTIMANGMKSGLSVEQSMSRVVENMKNPIRQEFKDILDKMQVGSTLEQELIKLAQRIPIADVQMFVTAVNILRETGGKFAIAFETIVRVIRERQKVEKKIQALTAQSLMQGMIISCVPFIIIGVFMVVDPNYIKPMFSTTLGLILLTVMLGLIIIGGLIIRKIVTIDV